MLKPDRKQIATLSMSNITLSPNILDSDLS